MKIKFIDPKLLMRTTDCFIFDNTLIYDFDGEIKTAEQFEHDSTNNIVTFYTEYDLGNLNFDEYYELEEECNDLEKFLALEESYEEFFVKDKRNLNLYFIGVPQRNYYQLYDDDLNLITQMVPQDED